MPTQNPISSDDIAHLVTEVLKRIRTETKTPSSTDSRLSKKNNSSLTATLSDRVIAAETIMNLSRETKVAYIVNKAVITPSARDIARERGIDFITAKTKPQQPADRQFIVAQADCTTNVSAAAGVLCQAVPTSQQLPAAGLVPTLEALADHAGRDAARCILLSEDTVVACMAANRFPVIRAVTATESMTLKNRMNTCAANVLILNPKDFSVGSLAQIAKVFALHPTENPPQILRPPQPAKDHHGCSCKNS